MKVWKLVAGILSAVFSVIILFQSCATGVVNTMENSSDMGGFAGLLVALLILSGGIVSISTRNSEKKAGNITLIVLFLLAALIGFTNAAVYKDLTVWGIWCLINVGTAFLALFLKKKS